VAQERSEGLQEEAIRRIVREETTGRPEAPAQAAAIADPTPVGLAGFALTTFLFSVINAGWLDQIGTFIPPALFYGGLVQLLAGMWAFRRNNPFGALVFALPLLLGYT
jgi:succinate-acetate transporter protein